MLSGVHHAESRTRQRTGTPARQKCYLLEDVAYQQKQGKQKGRIASLARPVMLVLVN